jgi:iron complex transport system ATP-binding protein
VKPRPILEISGLSVRRSATTILNGIDWRISAGEHWALLGANGSGKTSLLSVLTGYLTPTAGEISVLGQRYGRSDWRELRKRVGLVSSSIRQLMANDEPAVETVISGKYAMIDFWGGATTSDRTQARRMLERVDCGYLADRRWEVLSQGERQRVLIGRALIANPRLLILDEPCAGLDPAAREHFLQFLQKLGRGKTSPTLILVTHHVEEIMPVISHALLLKGGKTLAMGEKGEVMTGKLLSAAFSTRLWLQKHAGRYSMTVQGKSGIMV